MLPVRSIALVGLCFLSLMASSSFAFTVHNSAVVRRSSQSNYNSQEQKILRTETQIYGDNNDEERKVAVFEIPNVDAATRKYFCIIFIIVFYLNSQTDMLTNSK